MKLSEFTEKDYQIHDRGHLDRYLVKLCHLVIQGQHHDAEKYGMVAACVMDNDHQVAYGVNTAVGQGKRKHAERVAIEAYESKYGEIPEGSIIITTCSPCNEDMEERYGESCTDLINHSNVRKVYCGYMDPSQHDAHAEYTLEATSDKNITGLCKKFADTFLKKKFSVTDFKIDNFESMHHYRRWTFGSKISNRGMTRRWCENYSNIFVTRDIFVTHTLVESNEGFAKRRSEATKFSDYFKKFDQRDQVTLKVGGELSLLSATIIPGEQDHDSRIELSGFVKPKKISQIHLDIGGKIDTIEFQDGSRFPEAAEFTTVGGVNITNTIFFADSAAAAYAHTAIWMAVSLLEGQGWQVERYLD